MDSNSKNIFGTTLETCSSDPLTGFFRNGCCDASDHDHGAHLVCAMVTEAFLEFSKQQGNDLITPRPEFDFPGLKPGDSWCLCARRWQQAYEANMAPPINGKATHKKALEIIDFSTLSQYAIQ